MENRCDALLHNNYWIAFIELKVQKRNWIKRAVEEQLVMFSSKTTIFPDSNIDMPTHATG